jgi:HK97 family phage portal protein
MNMFQQGFNEALTAIKSIPTVFRQGDQEFARGGGRAVRILTGENTGAGDNDEIYASHVWTYSAINSISRNIAGVPFVFQTKQGPVREESKLANFFEKPNPTQGFGQFMESLVSWLHLNGEVVLVMRRKDENSIPEEMAAVDATNFNPVRLENGSIIGWTFDDRQGNKIPFRKHEIIFIRFWNPLDEIRGMSPISAARQGINQDILADKFNTNFFTNSGAPSGVIEIEQNLTDPEFERVVRQYEDNHGGPEKSHKMLILEGGAKFKPTVFTQKDMEFLSQKKWNRDATLAAFGVPKMEVGIIEEGANLAVIKMQSREFWLKNLIPKMNLIEWHLWAQLFSKISGGRVWAEFDTSAIDALQDEFHEKVKTARSLWEVGYPMNQINKRLKLGLPENSWQNTGFKPTQIEALAVDEAGTPIPPDNSTPQADPFTPPTTGEDTDPKEGKPAAPPPAPAGPKPRAAVADTEGRSAVALLSSKLQRFFYKQRVRQLKALEVKRTDILNMESEQTKLKAYLHDRGIVIDCKEVEQLVHTKLLVTAIKNFASTQSMLDETKQLYNKMDKAMPDMAAVLYNRHNG